jgi:hypothetical protein
MNHTTRLTDPDIAHYRSAGLIRSPVRLPDDVLVRMRASLERLLGDRSDVPPESLICPHIPSGGRHGAQAAAAWFEYATQPVILDLVEQLIGPNIILWGSQVFCKPERIGREVPWHQDGQYWPIRPLATCSVWIALDDVDADNGCMRYIPSSHLRERVYTHRVSDRPGLVLNQEVVADQFDAGTARDDVLRAGEFSLHDVYLIHGSNPNRSERRRAGFVVRYMPASSVFERDVERQQSQAGVRFSLSRRPLWLLRGTDVSGRNDFSIGHGEEYEMVPRVTDDT